MKKLKSILKKLVLVFVLSISLFGVTKSLAEEKYYFKEVIDNDLQICSYAILGINNSVEDSISKIENDLGRNAKFEQDVRDAYSSIQNKLNLTGNEIVQEMKVQYSNKDNNTTKDTTIVIDMKVMSNNNNFLIMFEYHLDSYGIPYALNVWTI